MKNLIEDLKIVCALVALFLTVMLVILGPVGIICITLWQIARLFAR
jgi:hypothetical protein